MDKISQLFQSYLSYLEEIRKRIYFLAIFFLLAFIVGFFSTGLVIKYLLQFFKIENTVVAVNSPFQFFSVATSIGFVSAVTFTFPLVIYSVFSFLRSALTKREKRIFIFLIPISIILFGIGFTFGILVMHYTFSLLAGINERLGIKNIWDVGFFLSQAFSTAVLLGLIFEFPVILTALIRLGLVSLSFLRRKRRLVIVFSFIVIALLPPTDGLSLILMVLPVILLYEITIFINSF